MYPCGGDPLATPASTSESKYGTYCRLQGTVGGAGGGRGDGGGDADAVGKPRSSSVMAATLGVRPVSATAAAIAPPTFLEEFPRTFVALCSEATGVRRLRGTAADGWTQGEWMHLVRGIAVWRCAGVFECVGCIRTMRHLPNAETDVRLGALPA